MDFLQPKHFSQDREANTLIVWDKGFLSRDGKGMQNLSIQ